MIGIITYLCTYYNRGPNIFYSRNYLFTQRKWRFYFIYGKRRQADDRLFINNWGYVYVKKIKCKVINNNVTVWRFKSLPVCTRISKALDISSRGKNQISNWSRLSCTLNLTEAIQRVQSGSSRNYIDLAYSLMSLMSQDLPSILNYQDCCSIDQSPYTVYPQAPSEY